MNVADDGSGPAGVGLLAAAPPVALDLGLCATPLLAALVAAKRTLLFSVCPHFDLRNRLRLSPEIPDLRLGVLDLGWIQFTEDVEKTAKIVM
ncbi:hypothetical protein SAMN06265370_102338 [Puniceibacterium sediminis]|uniref:Uncharacterized protein n=1 Tax=Puniceibacterium sediminis TaxID=1608407 RepID=A0A238VLG9_9RHOB|nr:hypothetical protein SAMN06265370_102338 [Puniceibacterium sediminis]